VFAGGGAGHVEVVDPLTGELASCTASCTVPATAGQQVRIIAATPSVFGGLSGACATSDATCNLTVGAGQSKVTATFTRAPGETFSKFLEGGSIKTAAFDSVGRLIIASASQVTKLSATGGTIWQQPLAVCNLATGPGNTIYAQTSTQVIKLSAAGAVLWQQPLDSHAVGCGRDENGFDGFVHNIAVAPDGAVAIHGNTGVARWDSNGTLTWTQAIPNLGQYGIAIDPHGVVHVAVSSDNGESQDLRRFAADGTELTLLEHVTPQYQGMLAIDPVGRLLVTSSGHSHTDFGSHTVELSDSDFAPNGIAAAASDAAWFHEDNDNSFFARKWTLERIHADNTSTPFSGFFTTALPELEELGTNPHDIAGALDGRVALVGDFHNVNFDRGWVTVYGP
jgi:hypothetical protein